MSQRRLERAPALSLATTVPAQKTLALRDAHTPTSFRSQLTPHKVSSLVPWQDEQASGHMQSPPSWPKREEWPELYVVAGNKSRRKRAVGLLNCSPLDMA